VSVSMVLLYYRLFPIARKAIADWFFAP
jgi:hypothetical protein